MLSLTQDIGHRLRQYEKKAGGVQIDVRNNQLVHKQWQCQLKTRTHSTAIIAKTAFELFARNYRWDYPIRSLTVRAINLHSLNEPDQLDLFGNITEVDRKERLETVVEEIWDRFGKSAIGPARLCGGLEKLPTDREIEIKMPTGMVN